MITLQDVRAEIETRLASAAPLPARNTSQFSEEARTGRVSPLDEALRHLGIHGMALSTRF